jgi:hypothetical protein
VLHASSLVFVSIVMSCIADASSSSSSCIAASPVGRSKYEPIDYASHHPPIGTIDDLATMGVTGGPSKVKFCKRVGGLMHTWMSDHFDVIHDAPEDSLDRRPVSAYVNKFIWLHSSLTQHASWFNPTTDVQRQEISMLMKMAVRTLFAEKEPRTHEINRHGHRSTQLFTLCDVDDTLSRSAPYSHQELIDYRAYETMHIDPPAVRHAPAKTITVTRHVKVMSREQWDGIQEDRRRKAKELEESQLHAAELQAKVDITDRQIASLPSSCALIAPQPRAISNPTAAAPAPTAAESVTPLVSPTIDPHDVDVAQQIHAYKSQFDWRNALLPQNRHLYTPFTEDELKANELRRHQQRDQPLCSPLTQQCQQAASARQRFYERQEVTSKDGLTNVVVMTDQV